MCRFTFDFLEPRCTTQYLPAMYDILYTNMSKIAPTGNTYEADKIIWSDCVLPLYSQGQCKVILIYSDQELAGYFQYRLSEDTFYMDDIQFKPEYQGSGVFADLYRYLVKIIPPETHYVSALSNKHNIKSQDVLKHLGLEIIGESQNGNSLRFRGDYADIVRKYLS